MATEMDMGSETSLSPQLACQAIPCKVVVSIINYKTPTLTISCIRSILAHNVVPGLVVVVIDNASGDGSDTVIRDWITSQTTAVPVILMASEVNLGFAGGHNAVMEAYAAAFYLLLNSDTVMRPDALAQLLATANRQQEAGILAPTLEDEDGTRQISCFRSHSPASELIRGAATGPVTRWLRRHDVPLGPLPSPAEIGWVSFACVLIRHAVIAETGGLDDGFFLYYEDAEFCHRACRAGWHIVQVPEARVVHFRGGSGPVKALSRATRRLPRYYYRSRSRYFGKTYGHAGLLAANLCWGAGRFIAAARSLFGKPVPRAHNCEWRDIWTGFLQPMRRASPGE